MRSARGDHHPPQPLEKQGSRRRGHPPGSQSKARPRAEPFSAAFCCPIPCPAGLRDSETEMLPRHLLTPLTSALPSPQPHSLPRSQLLVYLPVPATQGSRTAPALLYPRAPSTPWQKPEGPPSLITKTLCAVAPPPLQLRISLCLLQTNSL